MLLAIGFGALLGPILFGLLFLGVGMYLRLTPELSLPQARMIVLLAGGGFGLLLALLTVCQAWIWRPVFFGTAAKAFCWALAARSSAAAR